MDGVLQIVTPPSSEPVTTAEARLHARVDINQDDALIDSYIKAARAQAEEYCRRAFITQTWKLLLDRFPGDCPTPYPYREVPASWQYGLVLVPKAPLASVTHIKYIDTDGVQQTFSNTKYQVDTASEPARIVPAFGEVWPATREQLNAVEIQFVCGYGEAVAVPDAVKVCIKHTVAYWYNQREPVITGTIMAEMPNTAFKVLDNADLRLFRFD